MRVLGVSQPLGFYGMKIYPFLRGVDSVFAMCF